MPEGEFDGIINPLLFWQAGPAADKLADGKTYDDLKWDYFETIASRWRDYAPNLTEDKYLGKYRYTPSDIESRIIQYGGRWVPTGILWKRPVVLRPSLPGVQQLLDAH